MDPSSTAVPVYLLCKNAGAMENVLCCNACSSGIPAACWSVTPGVATQDSRGEVQRLIDTFKIAAEEATRIYGELADHGIQLHSLHCTSDEDRSAWDILGGLVQTLKIDWRLCYNDVAAHYAHLKAVEPTSPPMTA